MVRFWRRFAITALSAIFFAINFNHFVQSALRNEGILVDVEIRSDGSAYITETWNMSIDEGTELYKPLHLTKEQKLTEYTVKMDGISLEYIGDWDVDAGFSSKAGHYGRHGDELNWGITEYGNHTYEIAYKVSNFVVATNTDQMIFWKFVNDHMKPTPDSVTIRVASGIAPFDSKVNRIWGFGFQGEVLFENGKVIAHSTAPLDEKQYATILMRIPVGTYSTQLKTEKSFDDYVKEAFEGSNYDYKEYLSGKTYENIDTNKLTDPEEDQPLWLKAAAVLLVFLLFPLILILGIFAWFRHHKFEKIRRKYYPSLDEAIKDLKGEYYRDTPSERVVDIYVILKDLEIHNLDAHMLTACILALIYEGVYEVRKKERNTFLSKKDTIVFHRTGKKPTYEPLLELYCMLNYCSNKTGDIYQDRIEDFFENNQNLYDKLFHIFRLTSKKYLQEGAYLKKLQAKPKNEKTPRDIADEVNSLALTDDGLELRKNVVRFYNYLKDFSLLPEKEVKEIYLWDQLMIFSAAFGLLEEVEKQFDQIYPQWRKESRYAEVPMYHYVYLGQNLHRLGTLASRDSGYGGSTSLGGGGGSFGGGSGGGVR